MEYFHEHYYAKNFHYKYKPPHCSEEYDSHFVRLFRILQINCPHQIKIFNRKSIFSKLNFSL